MLSGSSRSTQQQLMGMQNHDEVLNSPRVAELLTWRSTARCRCQPGSPSSTVFTTTHFESCMVQGLATSSSHPRDSRKRNQVSGTRNQFKPSSLTARSHVDLLYRPYRNMMLCIWHQFMWVRFMGHFKIVRCASGISSYVPVCTTGNHVFLAPFN